MHAAPASHSACGLGSDGTQLVTLVREAGPNLELPGAMVTDGGSGGTVAVFWPSGEGMAPSVRSRIATDARMVTGRRSTSDRPIGRATVRGH